MIFFVFWEAIADFFRFGRKRHACCFIEDHPHRTEELETDDVKRLKIQDNPSCHFDWIHSGIPLPII